MAVDRQPHVYQSKKNLAVKKQDRPEAGAPAYLFVGEKADGIDIDALKEAKQMHAAGRSVADIWKKTGWGLAKDGKWRTEITDNFSCFSKDAVEMWANVGADIQTYDDYFAAVIAPEILRAAEEAGIEVPNYKSRTTTSKQVREYERKMKPIREKIIAKHPSPDTFKKRPRRVHSRERLV